MISALISQFSGYLLMVGGAFIFALIAYMKGRLSGGKLERQKNAAEKADAYEQSLKDLAAANTARNSVTDSVPDKDKYRRD